MQAQPAPGAEAPSTQWVTRVQVGWKASEPLAAGLNAWARGDKKKALRLFGVATKLTPADPIAWHDLGVALLDAKRAKEALVAFTHERFFSASAPSAWTGMGYSRLALQDHAGAENDFIMAVTGAPREWLNWHGLAHAQKAQGKTDAAKVAAHRAALLRPHPPKLAWSGATIQRAVLTTRIPSIRKIR